MASINVFKKLLEEQQVRTKSRKNTSEEQELIRKAYSFVETYVMSKINIYDIFGDLKPNQAKFLKDEMTSKGVDITLVLAQVKEDAPKIFQDKEYGFLSSNDTKIKKDIATRVQEYVLKEFTFDDKIDVYIEEYIKPILKELHQEKVIIYDVDSTDNETILITKNTMELAKKYIYYETKDSLMFPIFKYFYEEEYINDWDFLFNDNENAKKEFATMTKDFLLKHYKNINIKNIDKFDMDDYFLGLED